MPYNVQKYMKHLYSIIEFFCSVRNGGRKPIADRSKSKRRRRGVRWDNLGAIGVQSGGGLVPRGPLMPGILIGIGPQLQHKEWAAQLYAGN